MMIIDNENWTCELFFSRLTQPHHLDGRDFSSEEDDGECHRMLDQDYSNQEE